MRNVIMNYMFVWYFFYSNICFIIFCFVENVGSERAQEGIQSVATAQSSQMSVEDDCKFNFEIKIFIKSRRFDIYKIIIYAANMEMGNEDVQMAESNENVASGRAESHLTQTTDNSENGMLHQMIKSINKL